MKFSNSVNLEVHSINNHFPFLGTILNDLGLIFTQRQKYDRAVSCFESALPMVEGPSGDGKQLAVIFQNLGATFNFLGNYQRAVEYHEKAADMYGTYSMLN